MKKKLRGLAAFSLVFALSMGVLSGCTNNDEGSTGDSGNDPAVVTDEDSDDNTEQKSSGDNILRYGGSSFDGRFISIMSENVYDDQMNKLIFDKLIKNDAEGNWYNWLAEDLTMEDDNRTYVFTLKEGVKFWDGEPLTVEDVEFTYRTAAHKDYSGPRSYIVSDIKGYDSFHAGDVDEFEGIVIRDENTIAFTYNEAKPSNIRNFDYGILPKHYYEFNEWEEFLAKISTPLGSGPLVFDDYVPEQYIEFSKNEEYWNDEVELQIDGLLVTIIPNESKLGALQTGQVDFVEPDISPDNWEALKAMNNAQEFSYLGNGYTYMTFNTAKPQLSDVRVRQALMYALDRESFIQAQYGELAQVGTAPISPVSWAFPDESDLNKYEFDLEKAAELLDDAGWEMGSNGYREKDGETLSLSWYVYTDTDWPQTLAGMAADTWGQIGVDLKIELMDFVTVSNKTQQIPIEEREFDIYTMGFSLGVDPDPAGGLFDYDAYRPGGYCASGYYNERAQELIALGSGEFDQDKRAEYYQEWAVHMNENVPTVILVYRHYIWGFSDRLNGMNISAFCDWTHSLFDITLS